MDVREEIMDGLYGAAKACLVEEFGTATGLALHRWLVRYRRDPTFVEEVYALTEGDAGGGAPAVLTDEAKGISYLFMAGRLEVALGHATESFDAACARRGIQLVADAMGAVLPLGSVVELKRDELAANMDLGGAQHFRVVVTQRLAAPPGGGAYFDYGGVLWPFGTFEGCRSVYFSKALVAGVLHEGYHGDEDDAYIAALKSDLLFREGRASYRFAPPEERRRAVEAVREGAGR